MKDYLPDSVGEYAASRIICSAVAALSNGGHISSLPEIQGTAHGLIEPAETSMKSSSRQSLDS